MARPSRADARTAMTYTTLDYTVTDRVLTLTLNRPDRLNAFTVTMADELEHAFRRASADDLVGAIVVTGAGRAFCAGMDLATTGNVFGLDGDDAGRFEALRWIAGHITEVAGLVLDAQVDVSTSEACASQRWAPNRSCPVLCIPPP